jgi:hypothetical protein
MLEVVEIAQCPAAKAEGKAHRVRLYGGPSDQSWLEIATGNGHTHKTMQAKQLYVCLDCGHRWEERRLEPCVCGWRGGSSEN